MLDDKFELLLRLGDSALVLGQRLCEWVGKAPALEEDMALSNTGLDLIGQARMWLTYAGSIDTRGRSEDDLAYLRDAHEFRNVLLVERPNGDYANTVMRQFLFDSWHLLLLGQLIRSSDEQIAAIAEKARKEVTYHLRRSADLVVRLGDGTAESRGRMQAALDDLWSDTGELFTADSVDEVMHAQGIVDSVEGLRGPWLDLVGNTLSAATLTCPAPDAWMQKGGKQGRHTEQFGYLLAEMQFLQRAYPGQKW